VFARVVGLVVGWLRRGYGGRWRVLGGEGLLGGQVSGTRCGGWQGRGGGVWRRSVGLWTGGRCSTADYMANFTQVAAVLDHWFQAHGLEPTSYTVVVRCEAPLAEHRLRCALLADFDDLNFGFRAAAAADTSKIEVHGVKFEVFTKPADLP
jgi:hypothetical protein